MGTVEETLFNILTIIVASVIIAGIIIFEVGLIILLVKWLTNGVVALTFKQGFALNLLTFILFKSKNLNITDSKEE